MRTNIVNDMMEELVDDINMEFNKLIFVNKAKMEEQKIILFRQAVANIADQYKPKNPANTCHLKLIA